LDRAACAGLAAMGRRSSRPAATPSHHGLPHLRRCDHPHPVSDHSGRSTNPLSRVGLERMAVDILSTARRSLTLARAASGEWASTRLSNPHQPLTETSTADNL